MKMLNKIDDILSKIAIHFVRLLLLIIVLGMLVVNSVYLYIDMPTFRMNHVLNYLGILINVVMLVIITFFTKILNQKWNYKYTNLVLLLFYFIAEIVFLWLVPIRLFSDMFQVVRIAFSNFSEGMEYLQKNPNNLPIALIFNLIARITTYDVWVLKIFNCICNIVTIYFAYQLYENVYGKKNRLVLLFGMFFISILMYVNTVYNDIISTMLITICFYFVTKDNNRKIEKILIPVLLFLQFMIRPVGIIFIIATSMYYVLKKKNFKMVIAILLTFFVLDLGYQVIEHKMIPQSEEIKKYPIWSYLQMGINEPEFGFQDNSHSAEWTPEDVKNRMIELGPVRLIKLLAKKEYWMWTEGTYQVGRYAFGIGNDDQFYYDTFLTKQLYDTEDSDFRNGLDYVMKGQYFFMMLLALVDLVLKGNVAEAKEKKDLLLYAIVGIFCFYLVWEIKSRYILCLYPFFLIMATNGMQKIMDKISFLRKGEENGKI